MTVHALSTARDNYAVEIDAKGALKLPPTPPAGDVPALCKWLTGVFALDPDRPITAGERRGPFGPDGRVDLARADAPRISFEPATRLNSPIRMIEALSWQRVPSDGALPPYKATHCAAIVHVCVMLCGTSQVITDEQEAAGIVGTFTLAASAVEGFTTYGTSGQRFEAAVALRRPLDEHSGRPLGAARYLIDANTGELVIALCDLVDAARRHTGASLPRGWLGARMESLGWNPSSFRDSRCRAAPGGRDDTPESSPGAACSLPAPTKR